MLLLRQLSNATNWSITKKNSEHSCIAAVILRLIFTTSFLVTPSKIWLISVLTWLSSLCVFFLSSSAYDEKLDWCLYFCHLKFMTNFLVMMGRKLAPGATEFVVKSVWHNYSTKRFTMQKRLTPSLNFRHQFFNVKVSTQRWHTPGGLQIYRLTSLVMYFWSIITMAPSIGDESWKKGYFQLALENFARYLETRSDQISVGNCAPDSQELNPGRN